MVTDLKKTGCLQIYVVQNLSALIVVVTKHNLRHKAANAVVLFFSSLTSCEQSLSHCFILILSLRKWTTDR